MRRVAVVRFPGSNCDLDALRAAEAVGAEAYFIWVTERLSKTTGQVITVDGGLHEAFLR